jgi:hypothetical protein
MDALTKFENEFQKMRTAWTKAQWRKVAMNLAGIEPVETRGRKPKTKEQLLDDEQNVLVARFWVSQEILHKELTEKMGQGRLIPRTASQKISRKEAVKKIINDAVQREKGQGKKPTVGSLIKKIQSVEKNLREK